MTTPATALEESHRDHVRDPSTDCAAAKRRACERAAYAAAKAVCGHRFSTIDSALKEPEFEGADRALSNKFLTTMRSDPHLTGIARAAEEARRQAELVSFHRLYDVSNRKCGAWLTSQFNNLMSVANADALEMQDYEQAQREWSFALAEREDKRRYAFKFMTAVYTDLLANTGHGKLVLGGAQLLKVTRRIFGADNAYCLRTIRNCALAGISEPRQLGRAPSMPWEMEAVLFRFVSKLRALLYPVYPSTVIDYAKRLLTGTVYCLSFAKIVDGDYVPSEHSGVEWDESKLRNWFYRRFVGDRKQEGARTGNQVILDVPRARWQTYAAMRPYYLMHVDALIKEGIADANEAYCEDDVDAKGQPLQPIAFWRQTEMWRAVSFDETHLDDATHGEGGKRKARTERIVRCCAKDIGEVAGKRHGSYSASLVGGSNALGEPTPAYLVLKAGTAPAQSTFSRGPVATVNGRQFPTQGGHNAKGSVDTPQAIAFIRDCLLPMFEAHGGLRSDRKAVLVCDGVGTHMTEEFIDFCNKNHIVLAIRTPNCSSIQQFEDLVNFWELKNAGGGLNWYTLKQQALDRVLATTNTNGVLSHAIQLRLLVSRRRRRRHRCL